MLSLNTCWQSGREPYTVKVIYSIGIMHITNSSETEQFLDINEDGLILLCLLNVLYRSAPSPFIPCTSYSCCSVSCFTIYCNAFQWSFVSWTHEAQYIVCYTLQSEQGLEINWVRDLCPLYLMISVLSEILILLFYN